MNHNNHDIKYLESLVTGIKDVTGCRMVTDESGEITEIHVIADSERSGRLIARDVDTLLKVKAGVDIDHRKIGVVLLRDEPESVPCDLDQPDPVPEFIIEDIEPVGGGGARVVFDRLQINHEGGRVEAEVGLSLDGRTEIGQSTCADTADGHLSAVVRATLEAILMIYDAGMEFADPLLKTIPFGRDQVLMVHLSAIEGRDIRSYIGSAVIRQDISQAAVLATLAAVNRPAGFWQERQGLEFDIS